MASWCCSNFKLYAFVHWQGFLSIATMLKDNTTLQELKLDGNSADGVGAAAVAGSTRILPVAQCVGLWLSLILRALAGALPHNIALNTLSLNKVCVGREGAEAFAEYFGDRRNTCLTALELNSAAIDDAGAKQFVPTSLITDRLLCFPFCVCLEVSVIV